MYCKHIYIVPAHTHTHSHSHTHTNTLTLTHSHTYTLTLTQVEVLGGLVDELNAHSKALKTNQELTFTEPMKK